MTGKENRASNFGSFRGSLHTCGSITTSQHRYNLFVNYFLFINVHNYVKFILFFVGKDEWNASNINRIVSSSHQ